DLPEQVQTTGNNIPDWIRNNANWWSQGLISDEDFVKGIEFLVRQGIIQI
ncbi:MAG: phosphate ABC transporter substrate-binding protein PstS, partial [Thaumarchaeota archaeon]|nr:phosphate ABC transporter substrate-binding protein PstS [Nitrososphaerota archaeon]